MKELGVVFYNCSSLAQDLYKIFESYWVMGESNSTLPRPWPPQYDTDINKQRPLLVKTENVSSSIYLSVSFSLFVFFFYWWNWNETVCIELVLNSSFWGGAVSKPPSHQQPRLCWTKLCLLFTPGCTTLILPCLQNSGPASHSVHHLGVSALRWRSRHGLFSYYQIWKAS